MGLLSDLLNWLFHRSPNPMPPTPPPNPSPIDIKPGSVVAEINISRLHYKRDLLQEDPTLNQIAQNWAANLAYYEDLAHGNFYERISAAYPNRPMGETIACGQINPPQLVSDWMNDPPHRETLLGNYNSVGVGIAMSAAGQLYWVADFVLV